MGRKGKMQDHLLKSEYLAESIEITWYLPENFSSMSPYHTCLMQDGDDYFQMGRVATLSDKLHENGEIATTVFVGIPYQDKYDRLEKYHPEGKNHKAYIDFLVTELIPFLDQELPSFHMGGKPQRTLMGDSLGGTVSFVTALQYPELFDKVIMQSPYVDEHVFDVLRQARPDQKLEIYHTIGTRETEVSTTIGDKTDFLTPNRKLAEQLKNRKNFTCTYRELDGGHSWKSWQQDLERALASLFL